MKFIDDILKKPLWMNVLIGFGVALVLLIVFFFSLGWITGNGETEKVPAVIGLDVAAAEKNLTALGFDVELQDSIYVDTLARNAVLRQTPEADEIVKKGRTVYLTINRVIAPQVDMPNLVGFSIKSAETYLKVLGLRLGSIQMVPDQNKNVVIDQLVNGQPIAPGSKIPSGTLIHFLVGDGGASAGMLMPDLVGLTYEQAKAQLASLGLNLGVISVNGSIGDSASAFVYDQNPSAYGSQLDSLGMPMKNSISKGATINLVLDKVAPVKTIRDTIQ
ncbi:MAG: PASTA domain-containing protein [Sediminibacterium sp.]|nr:PASTA domain-containing protein [Sediminibacterium sp.]MBP6145288.1 PASTA domain-containing protein [Sediminibacterium sp.]